jgi:hypothetical protein
MEKKKSAQVHVLEFDCQGPLRFYEKCSACPRFDGACKDLAKGAEILRGRKKLVYNQADLSGNTIHASAFECLTPIHYFEHSRVNCGHKGRCREEGLLLALLTGKKTLDYSERKAIRMLPAIPIREDETIKEMSQQASS